MTCWGAYVQSIIEGVSSINLHFPDLTHKSIYLNFKIQLVRYLVDEAATEFEKNVDKIVEGKFCGSLLDDSSPAGSILKILKKFAKQRLFSSVEAIDIELASNAVIRGILDKFLPIMTCSSDAFYKLIPGVGKGFPYGEKELERRLVLALPKRHLQNYLWQRDKGHPELALRIHLILDYVSGMTDKHALEVFHMLHGISAKVRS